MLQRVDSPNARYDIALPADRQFIGLIILLPDWVCQRLNLCFYLVWQGSDGLVVGFVPPRGSLCSGLVWAYSSQLLTSTVFATPSSHIGANRRGCQRACGAGARWPGATRGRVRPARRSSGS